ncbi:MAG: D-2-hydroxyacid dehydrogenase [Anaerolineae bacterium]|nr:D-2-hydroxyacid dehydrogenase [Anaerolineae bacterium]
MAAGTETQVNVIVAMDFSDAIMDKIRAVSPQLKVERCFPDVPDKALADVEVLYTQRFLPDPAQTPHLRWVQLHSAGVDHAVNQPVMQSQDVEVTTTSGIHATFMTEYCVMMMLAFAFKLPLMMEYKAQAEWPNTPQKPIMPDHLRGKTVGIVGYGVIGRELGRVANALGMRVLASKRDVMHPADHDSYRLPDTGDPEGEIPVRIYPPEALRSMVSECDYLVVITPLTAASRHLVDENILSAMKKTAILINIARGAVVDEQALISALAAKTIAGAALDVFETEPLPNTSPLWNLDNVIISPHIAGNSVDYHEKAADLFIENLERYLENRPLLNVVDRERGY